MTTKPHWAQVSGPLTTFAGGFRVELERQGYTPLSAAMHVRLMAHPDRWMAREGLTVSALTPTVVERYFAERRSAGYFNERTPRALQPLLGHLLRWGHPRDRRQGFASSDGSTDNAVAEAWFAALKRELPYGARWATPQRARLDVFAWISFYNNK